MSKLRPKRFLEIKECDRCHETKTASEFPKVRGGGTSDVCNDCKRKAVSESMKEMHARHAEVLKGVQQEHFDAELEERRKIWDSLPDGHPYKSPRRP